MGIEKIQTITNNYYGRFMSYASKLKKQNKKNEAATIHSKAQQLNKCLYLAAHSSTDGMILCYTKQAQEIVVEIERFVKEV